MADSVLPVPVEGTEKATAAPQDGLEWGPSSLLRAGAGAEKSPEFETVGLLNGNEQPAEATTAANTGLCPCFSMKFYQPFFNVDSSDVLSRLIASVLPFKSPLLFESIASNPDLYGPFWVAATLVFVIGAAANWNSWIKTPTENAHEWSYDFTLMSVSMSVVFGYLGCVPIAIWATMRYYSVPIPFLQLLCTFGYSLTVFVPTAILCIAPSNVFAWLAVSYATMTASSLLAVSVYPVVKEYTATANPSVRIGLIAAPITTQIGFALIMKFFFFGQTS